MEFKAQQIAEYLGGTVEGRADATVHTFAKIEEGTEGALSFLSDPKYEPYLYQTLSNVVLVPTTFQPSQPVRPTLVRVDSPREALARLLALYESMKPRKTGVDSLAISIGTSHGAYKFTPEQCTVDPKTGRLLPPPLAFDVLKAIEEKLPGFPIVLHGSSSVPQEDVDIINANGGALKQAVGIPEEQLRQASKSAVCKINIDSDSRLAMTAAIRKTLAEKPAEFDPRKYLGPARDRMKELYKHKITDVLGSDGKLIEQ